MAEVERMARRLAELSPVAVQGMNSSMVRGDGLDYAAIDQITDVIQNRVMNSRTARKAAAPLLRNGRVAGTSQG